MTSPGARASAVPQQGSETAARPDDSGSQHVSRRRPWSSDVGGGEHIDDPADLVPQALSALRVARRLLGSVPFGPVVLRGVAELRNGQVEAEGALRPGHLLLRDEWGKRGLVELGERETALSRPRE